MTVRPEDVRLVKQLEEVAIGELDRQFLDGEIKPTSTDEVYFDAVDGELTGRPNWFKVISAVLEAFWEEEGR